MDSVFFRSRTEGQSGLINNPENHSADFDTRSECQVSLRTLANDPRIFPELQQAKALLNIVGDLLTKRESNE